MVITITTAAAGKIFYIPPLTFTIHRLRFHVQTTIHGGKMNGICGRIKYLQPSPFVSRFKGICNANTYTYIKLINRESFLRKHLPGIIIFRPIPSAILFVKIFYRISFKITIQLIVGDKPLQGR